MVPRLLFDENLAPRLVSDLADLFPDSNHVRAPGLNGADDETVWERAAEDGFIIVTKDDDFRQRSFRGHRVAGCARESLPHWSASCTSAGPCGTSADSTPPSSQRADQDFKVTVGCALKFFAK
jgi:hypothetical protein